MWHLNMVTDKVGITICIYSLQQIFSKTHFSETVVDLIVCVEFLTNLSCPISCHVGSNQISIDIMK
jgi:thymidine kinase